MLLIFPLLIENMSKLYILYLEMNIQSSANVYACPPITRGVKPTAEQQYMNTSVPLDLGRKV